MHRIQFSYASWNFRLKRITTATVLLKIQSFQYQTKKFNPFKSILSISNADKKFKIGNSQNRICQTTLSQPCSWLLENFFDKCDKNDILRFFLFQLHIRALSTSELIAAFESIRHTTEEEILPKLNKKKSDREMLEGLAKKTAPRNFLSIPIKNLTSITDELIV